jgi:hypothetical protein
VQFNDSAHGRAYHTLGTPSNGTLKLWLHSSILRLMSESLNLITAIAFVGLVLFWLFLDVRSRAWNSLGLELFGTALVALLLNRLFGFPFASHTAAKGTSDELVMSLALFICMVLGMLSQHLYDRFGRSKANRSPWDWGTLLAPIFVSPIVYIPLLASFESSGLNLSNFTSARLMIFLVAFQNGFFWKDFFDRKKTRSSHG